MGELKPGWKRVKFGDVVRLGKERCDPAADGIERYIGLEHMEPGDLRVRSWGDVSEGTTFTTRVRPGHVLFGKRRAYQRKVAVADFDAVCSGDIYVFESANPAQLIPELLPFLCQTDAFFDHAVGTSAGSLSPRTNWTSLAEFELALPPLEEQRRLLAVLASSRALRESLTTAETAAGGLLEAVLDAEIGAISSFAPLQAACRPIVRGIDSPGPDTLGGVPYVRIAEMTGSDEIVVERLLRTSKEKADAQPESRLEAGDMVVALRGVVGLPVWVPPTAAGANLSRGTARVSVERAHNGRFIYWALRSPSVKREVLRNCTGWKGEDLREITLGALRGLMIPLPPRATQDAVADRIQAIALCQKSLAARNARAREMHKVMLDALHAECER